MDDGPDSGVGVALAAIALAVLVAVAGPGALAGRPFPLGASLALVGVGGFVAAYGDGRLLPEGLGSAVRGVGWALFVGFAGLFAVAAWATVLVSLAGLAVPGDVSTLSRTVLGAVALGLGTGTVALAYLGLTDTGLEYLDFRVPTLADLGYVLAGVGALLGVMLVGSVVLSGIGVSTADHSAERAARAGDATLLLLLVPASWLLIGPGEELLYRNIVQKSLSDTFGDRGAVVVASVAFALAHVLAYAAGATLASLAATLAIIFLLSLVLGAVYLRTDNTTVPALVHGTFDAVVFASMYVAVTGGA